MRSHLAISVSSLPWCSKNFKAMASLWVLLLTFLRAELFTTRTELPLFAIHGFWQCYHLLQFSSWTLQVAIYWAIYFWFSCFSFTTKLQNMIILLLEGSCAKSLPRAMGFCRHRKVEQFSPGLQRLLVTEMPEVFFLQCCLLHRVMWDLLAHSPLKDPSIPSSPELCFL